MNEKLWNDWKQPKYLVIKTALGIKVIKELCVSFASPEVHVGDLEVAPDYGER